jgi:FAD-dependent urate hydroxylase
VSEEQQVIVCGAGVGGLAATNALIQQGFDVLVVERAPRIRTPDGLGLTIWGNGMTALSTLGLAGSLRVHGEPLERQVVATDRGVVLSELPVGRIQRSLGEVGVGVRRSDLLATLLEAARPAAFRCGSAVTDVRVEGKRVVATLDCGEEIVGHVLIGADGLRSNVRAAVLCDGAPQALDHGVWRGISAGRGDFPAKTSLIVFGSHATRMAAWPVDEDHVCWSIATHEDFEGGRKSAATPKRDLLQALASFPAPCRHVLAETPEEQILRRDLFARRELRQMAHGPIALLGDAAHAMPPVFGQGAAMAIEDAVVLAGALARNRDCPPDGLLEYERARLPRLRLVRKTVFRANRLQSVRNPLSHRARDSLLRLMPDSASRRLWTALLRFPDAAGMGALP